MERVFGRYNLTMGNRVRVKVAHAPKLQFLGYCGMALGAFEIGSSMFTVSN